ncbi:hypothetical protein EYF80_068273 [Liparis tanakae]|uniref:Uncharacterized protein n=1 Tax=Liparis tanakae TaxID=230148 RepID=A0A4Z2DYF9_9TELE|nr:hypothetical protein EYF80_068273 [Liparis tanakae]
MKRNCLHRCSMSQKPGHSATRHSFIRVRATTFGCPKGSHRANLSRLRMTSINNVARAEVTRQKIGDDGSLVFEDELISMSGARLLGPCTF